MYTSQAVAEKIKSTLKERHISARKMLEDCGINKNALFTMQSGNLPRVDVVAQIADYLDCSVDYLLGRENQKEASSPIPMLGEDAQKLLEMFGELDAENKDQVMRYVTSTYYVYKANKSAQYTGALAAYEGGTQQHTISKETAEEVLRLIDGMGKNT